MLAGTCTLNYMERLPSRSPGIPDIFLLRSVDQLHFEVCPHVPHILVWMTYAWDHQLQPGTRSSPSCTANCNLALGRHLYSPSGTLIQSGSWGPITDVDEVTPHWLTIISKPQEEPSLVQYFLLSHTVVLNYIGRYSVHHAGNYRMQIIIPPVLELPPLSSKGI